MWHFFTSSASSSSSLSIFTFSSHYLAILKFLNLPCHLKLFSPRTSVIFKYFGGMLALLLSSFFIILILPNTSYYCSDFNQMPLIVSRFFRGGTAFLKEKSTSIKRPSSGTSFEFFSLLSILISPRSVHNNPNMFGIIQETRR